MGRESPLGPNPRPVRLASQARVSSPNHDLHGPIPTTIGAATCQPTNPLVTCRACLRLFKLASLQYDVGLSAPSPPTRQVEVPAGSYSMQPFRTLEHTADVGFEAFGATREEVFANAARALMNIIVDLDTIKPSDEVTLEIHGPDPESVLVNWLSEILYLHD